LRNDVFKVDQNGSCGQAMNVYFSGDYNKIAKTSDKKSDKPAVVDKSDNKTSTPAVGEQKIIFKTNSVEFKTKGVESSENYCKEKCDKISEDISTYLAQGWKVSSSVQRKQVIDQLCTCDGMEYIISK